MPRGIVVDHKTSGVQYAISERNFNPAIHSLVRHLKPGETVLGFRPRKKTRIRADFTPSQENTPDPEETVQPQAPAPKRRAKNKK